MNRLIVALVLFPAIAFSQGVGRDPETGLLYVIPMPQRTQMNINLYNTPAPQDYGNQSFQSETRGYIGNNRVQLHTDSTGRIDGLLGNQYVTCIGGRCVSSHR